jgi:signal transduction histidine kinase
MKVIKTSREFARRPMDDARLAMARLSPVHTELEQVFRRICRLAADTISVERVGIWLFVHERTALHCAALYERSRGEFSAGTTLQVADFPAYFESVASRKTIPAESAADDPRTRDLLETYLQPLGIAAMLDASILLDDEVAGVVCHEHVGGPREWTTEERDFAGSVADIVALKLQGARLEEAQRLRQLGVAQQAAFRQRDSLAQLAAGVAHDFRNLLTIVLGNAEEIRLEAAEQPAIVALASTVLEAARRGSALSAQLMELAHNQAGHPRVLDVVEALTRALPLLQQAAGARHRVEFSHDENIGRVFIDAAQLDRVVLNLVVNARDAMPEGGTIRMRLGEEPATAPALNRRMVMIEVRDTGRGMDPAVLSRIFDPFFTTKSREGSSGLGLAVVKHVVELAGGHVAVESVPGTGATFRVFLPRVAG